MDPKVFLESSYKNNICISPVEDWDVLVWDEVSFFSYDWITDNILLIFDYQWAVHCILHWPHI